MIKLEGNVGLRTFDETMCKILPIGNKWIYKGFVKWTLDGLMDASHRDVVFAGWAMENSESYKSEILICTDPFAIFEVDYVGIPNKKEFAFAITDSGEIDFSNTRHKAIELVNYSPETHTALAQYYYPLQLRAKPMTEIMLGYLKKSIDNLKRCIPNNTTLIRKIKIKIERLEELIND